MSHPSSLARFVDHTLLKPNATRDDIERVCREALKHDFAGVCVNSCWIGTVAELLMGSEVKPIAVIGFPLGAMATTSKAFETWEVLRDGALEVDMVINVGWLKGGELDRVRDDITAVVEAAVVGADRIPVKVIIETALLTDDEKRTACRIAKEVGAAFVKTCTGFGGGGATVEDIRLMREVVGPDMGVKAAGGVRDEETFRALIAAGATRVGTSAGVAIVSGHVKTSDGY